jgi:hypothetical protein
MLTYLAHDKTAAADSVAGKWREVERKTQSFFWEGFGGVRGVQDGFGLCKM